MSKTTKYRGVLKDVDLTNLNDKLIRLLEQKQIIINVNHLYSEIPDGIYNQVILKQNSINLSFPLFYKSIRYTLNELITIDIYNITKDLVEDESWFFKNEKQFKKFYDIAEENIKLNLINDKTEKTKHLNKKRTKAIKKIKDLGAFQSYLSTENNDIWEQKIKDHIRRSPETLIYYLQNSIPEDYDFFNPGTKDNIFNYLNNTNLEWRQFKQTKDLLDLFTNSLDNKNANKNITKNHLYQVLFIDCLRKVKDEKQFNDKNMLHYLNALTNHNNYDQEYQLSSLRELIHLNNNIYTNLTQKELGQKINAITNSDLDGLRKNCAIITKKAIDFTPIQRKKFKNSEEIKSKIYSTINSFG